MKIEFHPPIPSPVEGGGREWGWMSGSCPLTLILSPKGTGRVRGMLDDSMERGLIIRS